MTITIVGAGIVGCAIAYELASRGARVSVLDPRGIGLGATQASAGILAPWIEGHSPELLALGACSLELYERFVARVSADASQPVELVQAGTLQAALSDAEAADLAQAARRLDDAGVEHALLEPAAIARLEPALSPRVTAALLIPRQGYTAAGALAGALARAATGHGATFISARVDAVQGGSPRASVQWAGGVLESDAVIVAAGSWSSDLIGESTFAKASVDRSTFAGASADRSVRPAPVRPIRGQLLRLRAPAPPARRVLWGSRCYLVPWSDGTLLVGATMEDVGFDERATAAGVRGLLDAAMELVPAVATATFEAARAGLRPMASDELPAIGASTTLPNVFFATGHHRNGVLLAPLTASLVADLVLEGRERPELALTRPGRIGL